MRKTIAICIVLTGALVAIPLKADTETVNGITWTYRVKDDAAELYGSGMSFDYRGWPSHCSNPSIPSSTSGTVLVPSSLGGFPVVSIGESSFAGCGRITNITLPNSVTNIGNYAFSLCNVLTNVTILGDMSCIGRFSFYKCIGLSRFVIPNGVISIGDQAFNGCSCLTNVTISDSVEKIGSSVFYDCNPSLFDATTIPGVNIVDGWAIGHTGTLTGSLDLTGIRGIASGAFARCADITSVTIPNSVKSLGSVTFRNCSSLTTITIPDSVKSIENQCFQGCSNLTSVTVGACVSSIKGSPFRDCNNLAFFEFRGCPPAGVTGCLAGMVVVYPQEYQEEWLQILGNITTRAMRIDISSNIRESDPTILDCTFKVLFTGCSRSMVKVRALAYEDGWRNFAKVVTPETFVDDLEGNPTGQNIGDNIEVNMPHKLSWKVPVDWATRLAKVKFEVLALNGELLPLKLRTIPASDQYGKMKISWNAISESQVFDALLWLYADKDPGLTLAGGVLKNGTTQLAIGASTSNPNAIRYIYSKMGYQLLTGAPLNYANSETRLGLSPSGVRQYAYKIVQE